MTRYRWQRAPIALLLPLAALSAQLCPLPRLALLVRTSGAITGSKAALLRTYARQLAGTADFWVQYDGTSTSPAQPLDVPRDGYSASGPVAPSPAAQWLAAEARVGSNFRVHLTSLADVLLAFPFLRDNWRGGEQISAWGGLLGRQQHETFVARWWAAHGRGRYGAVWAVEDDARYGGDVGGFVRRFEGARACGEPLDYAGSAFMPSFEALGTPYVRSQWQHWEKARHVTARFQASVPKAQWVRKVEYVERFSGRLLEHIEGAVGNGSYAFGEFFASSLCRAAPWCRMRDLACCPPTAAGEFLRHCKYSGLPRGQLKRDVFDCVALKTRHWVDPIPMEHWLGRRLNESRRWYHPIKWRRRRRVR